MIDTGKVAGYESVSKGNVFRKSMTNLEAKKLRDAVKRCALINIISAAVLCAASAASAHGTGPGHIYEGPSPGTWITIIMVVSWIVIALCVVFFVLRLIRSKGSKKPGGDK